MKARFINPYTDFGFKKLFGEEANKTKKIMEERAGFVNSTRQKLQAYEDSLKTYRDLKGVIDTSHDEGYDEGYETGHENGLKEGEEQGIDKGRKQEKIDLARLMKQAGESSEKIARYTGLTSTDIEKL